VAQHLGDFGQRQPLPQHLAGQGVAQAVCSNRRNADPSAGITNRVADYVGSNTA
jgi:hypothetical protein